MVDLGREAVGGLLERSLFFLARRHCNVLHGRKIRWDVDERSIHGFGAGALEHALEHCSAATGVRRGR